MSAAATASDVASLSPIPNKEGAMPKFFEYGRYLASREWAIKKRAVKERSGGVCERCETLPHYATHHLTYERIGHEEMEDLQGVCRPCHAFLSASDDWDPLVWRERFLVALETYMPLRGSEEGYRAAFLELQSATEDLVDHISEADAKWFDQSFSEACRIAIGPITKVADVGLAVGLSIANALAKPK